MATEQLAEDILYITLQAAPHINRKLELVNDIISKGGRYHIILNLEYIDIITSANISTLLILNELLKKQKCQLILCNVIVLTKWQLTAVGLRHYFLITENKAAALKLLKHATQMVKNEDKSASAKFSTYNTPQESTHHIRCKLWYNSVVEWIQKELELWHNIGISARTSRPEWLSRLSKAKRPSVRRQQQYHS